MAKPVTETWVIGEAAKGQREVNVSRVSRRGPDTSKRCSTGRGWVGQRAAGGVLGRPYPFEGS